MSSRERTQLGAWAVAILPVTWSTLFIVLPLLVMLLMSFWTYRQFSVEPTWTLANYRHVLTDYTTLYITARTFLMALCSSSIAVVAAYPIAYFLAFKVSSWRNTLLLLVIIPFWTGYLVRVYAWMSVLGENGLLNTVVASLFGNDSRITILYTPLAVVLVSAYVFLPFAVVIIYSSLRNIGTSIIEAGYDLGANAFQNFLRVTLPLSASGVRAAWLFTFLPVLGLYATPVLVGGPNSMMIGNLTVPILQEALNYPQGSAIILTILGVTGALLFVLGRGINVREVYAGGVGKRTRDSEIIARKCFGLIAYAVTLYVVLYVPIVVLIMFSFNASASASLPFTGFTLRWYRDIANDSWIQHAVLNSGIVAGATTLISLVLAVGATYVITRSRLSISRLLNVSLLIPILVPSLMMGSALLTMFYQFGIALSMVTIVIGHVTRVLPFVFVSLMAQQAGFDRRLEEAAADLGASPWQTFWRVTIPGMLPGLVAGGLFAFTLSLDEFNMSFLLTGVETTVPVYMWGMLRTTLSPNINALSTALIVVSVGLVLLGQAVGSARRRRDQESAIRERKLAEVQQVATASRQSNGRVTHEYA